MAIPSPSTVASWAIYFIPLYIFVLAPLLQQIFPDSSSSSTHSTTKSTWDIDRVIEYDAEGNEISPLNLEDDSFISPEDDRPLNCPGGPGVDGSAYQTHILSHDPLVIYIENFLSDSEADHLVDVRWVTPFPPPLPPGYLHHRRGGKED